VGDVIIVAAYDCVADPTSHAARVAVFQNNKVKEVREVKLL
jgi:aspartate 1-decarboxylase